MSSPSVTIPLDPEPRRILIIKPSAIGDVVHTLPILNLLRRRFASSHIAWLVTPACAGLLEGHPQLDEVMRFERRRFAQGWWNPKAALGLLRFVSELRRRKFDLVIDLQGLFRSGWLAGATRAPVRVGFANAREKAGIFYTHHVPVGSSEQHAIDRYLKIAAALGCASEPIEFTFPTDEADRAHVRSLLNGIERYAVLLPGTNWKTKRWPVEHFAALVGPLRERYGLSSIVAGGPDAAELARGIPGAVSLAGRTTLRQLVALLEKAEFVVANDSGPMHIAAALNRPLVTLFGPTNPVRTGPYRRQDSVARLEIECSPCYSRTCTYHIRQSCLRDLPVETVLTIAARQIEPHGTVRLTTLPDL